MQSKTAVKQAQRAIRHRRIRARVSGTAERPRLCVYRSNRRLIAQLIDDESNTTIAGVASDAVKGSTPSERAAAAGTALAEAAKKQGISSVVFDRGGFQYFGAIKVFAEAAREAGLVF